MPYGLDFEVIKLAQGEKIDRDGVYDMPMEWYHDDCCVGPSISSTGLRKIREFSPAHYWAESSLNPDLQEWPEDEEKKAFVLGGAVHHLLLDPANFSRLYMVRPSMWADWRTKAAQAWRAERWAEGVHVMDGDEMAKVKGMADALKGHQVHRDGILDGAIELSIVWKDPKTGVWIKSRPDAIPLSGAMLADIKCLRDCRRRPFAMAVKEYRFDMQMALGGIGIEHVIHREIEDYVLVGVETKAPHVVVLRPIDSERIRWSRLELRYAIDTFATCWRAWSAAPDDETRARCWPGLEHDDGLHVMVDEWEKTRNKEEQASGLLPKEY